MCISNLCRRVLTLASAVFVVAAGLLFAQERAAQERRREQWQKVDDIFAAMASTRAVLTLKKFGVSNARALIGGFEQWQATGNPVETGKK